MATVLSKEVAPAPYAETPKTYEEPLRDEIIAQIAQVSVGEMVELNVEHYKGIKTQTFELPVLVNGCQVFAHRAGNTTKLPGTNTSPRGGTRMYWSGGPMEAAQLADGMDTKFMTHMNLLVETGVVDPSVEVPVGGKSEIVMPVDPRMVSPLEKAEVIAEFVKSMDGDGLFFENGHRTGPDMNMGPEDMALMRDVLVGNGYSVQMANSWITGKPVDSGGVAGRDTATPRGGATVLDEYLQLLGVPDRTKVRFSLNGFGNAGAPLVNEFNEVSDYEGELSCVSDQFGSVYSSKGIDADAFKGVLFKRDKHGKKHYQGALSAGVLYRNEYDPDAVVVSNAENPDFWLEVPADCYVPASVASAVRMENVYKLIKNIEPGSTIFVMPLANHGVSTPAQVELERHGVRTTHHAHFNSHGVVASLVESAFARGAFTGQDPTNPAFVRGVIDYIARNKTKELFRLSNNSSLSPTASLAVATEALRIQILKERLG